MNTETEIIDRLFLELSQFTKATTAKELKLRLALEQIRDTEEDPMGNGVASMRMRLIAKEALKP